MPIRTLRLLKALEFVGQRIEECRLKCAQLRDDGMHTLADWYHEDENRFRARAAALAVQLGQAA